MAALEFEDKVPADIRAPFATEIRNMASNLELPGKDVGANWIMGVMNSESGINPYIQNSIDATGFIQFLPSTAIGLGTTTDALKNMGYMDQLDYVYKYFSAWKGKIKSYLDLYTVTFYPPALGQPLSYVFPDWVLAANPGLDTNGDGVLTLADFQQFTLRYIPASAMAIFTMAMAIPFWGKIGIILFVILLFFILLKALR